ncbi:MAG: type II toxin-antitoxin system VapC family toxin [Coriobacteriales bacterium]|nr:type II toxin-antitoxin system VapC family toxin [Coriobacteriales bacterium]
MRLLLDTHIALWALEDSPRLPARARELILDASNQVFVGVASIWEVQIKHAAHPNRMVVDGPRFCALCQQAGYELVPIEAGHVLRLARITRAEGSRPHNDPFDRILLCLAIEENMRFVTHDSLIPDYEETCVLLV